MSQPNLNCFGLGFLPHETQKGSEVQSQYCVNEQKTGSGPMSSRSIAAGPGADLLHPCPRVQTPRHTSTCSDQATQPRNLILVYQVQPSATCEGPLLPKVTFLPLLTQLRNLKKKKKQRKKVPWAFSVPLMPFFKRFFIPKGFAASRHLPSTQLLSYASTYLKKIIHYVYYLSFSPNCVNSDS